MEMARASLDVCWPRRFVMVDMYSPSWVFLLKIFETKTLGSDLELNKAGLNVAVRLAPDWLVAGLIIAWVSRGEVDLSTGLVVFLCGRGICPGA